MADAGDALCLSVPCTHDECAFSIGPPQEGQLADALAAVNKPLSHFEMVSFLLAGLGSEYDPFVTSVQTRVEPLPIEELYGHLLAHELHLDHQNTPFLMLSLLSLLHQIHNLLVTSLQ